MQRIIIFYRLSGCQDNFTVARYKQELAKPYSKADLFICKEADFKADSEMNLGLRREKPLIDLPSDDDSIFDRSVFDIAHPSYAGGTFTFLPLKPVHRSPSSKFHPVPLILPQN